MPREEKHCFSYFAVFFFTWLFVSKSLVHAKSIFILLTAVPGCVLTLRNQHELSYPFSIPVTMPGSCALTLRHLQICN